MELTPSRNNQLTEWEFELLAKGGTDLFVKLITQRVRVADRDTVTGTDFIESVVDYLDANVFKQYYFRKGCLLYTSPSPRDRTRSRMPSSA